MSSVWPIVDPLRRTFWLFQHPLAPHHRVGQVIRFGGSHSAEVNRHCQRAHLVIGNPAQSKIFDQGLDFLGGERLVISLLLNERRNVQ